MKNLVFTLVLVSLLFANCSKAYYQTSSYETLALQHHIIAVLPSETITTGRIPEDWTEDMIIEMEELESAAFQMAIFDEVAQRSGVNDNNISINIQHYTETNAKLDKAGISLRNSWRMSPVEIAAILDVDAVVRTAVRKDRFLTELESFGVSIASRVVYALGGDLPWFLTNKTSDVYLSAAILDGQTSTAVWAMDKTTQTDWNTDHLEIVRHLSRVMARRFPYRN